MELANSFGSGKPTADYFQYTVWKILLHYDAIRCQICPRNIPKKNGSVLWGFTRSGDRHRRCVLVWEATKEEHNWRLKTVLQRYSDIHMTLNKEKCRFGSSKVVFLGHIISAEGISPDPEKVKAINQMRTKKVWKDFWAF